ncbi:MAG: hypothetical protein IKZ05_01715 [Clostridia bacterium]|nr:hypothetical protein [Clostridia bacterium]
MKRISVLLLILSVLLCSCGSHIFDSGSASAKSAQSFLDGKADELETLYAYFVSLNCYSMTVYLDEYKAIVLKTTNGYNLQREDVEITDKTLKRAIRRLYYSGGESFFAKGNGFHIVLWTSLADFGAGIVYNESGSELVARMQLDFPTKIEKLDADGYFYYEEDYNKYRVEHYN